ERLGLSDGGVDRTLEEAAGGRLLQQQIGQVVDPELPTSTNRVVEQRGRRQRVALDAERHCQVLLCPAQLDEGARGPRHLDGFVQPYGWPAGEQLDLAQLHQRAEPCLGPSCAEGLCLLPGPGFLRRGAIAEIV